MLTLGEGEFGNLYPVILSEVPLVFLELSYFLYCGTMNMRTLMSFIHSKWLKIENNYKLMISLRTIAKFFFMRFAQHNFSNKMLNFTLLSPLKKAKKTTITKNEEMFVINVITQSKWCHLETRQMCEMNL